MLQEMKVKISELQDALNVTRLQLEEQKSEQKTHKKAMANLTIQVKKRSFRRERY